MEEVTIARDLLRQAQQNFENADPEYIEIAVYQLKAAEEQYNTALKQIKKGERR